MLIWLLLAVLGTAGGKEDGKGVLTVLYSVSPSEGFNLRRDVLLRMALAARPRPVRLLLPPWRALPHWRGGARLPWSRFFDVPTMAAYTDMADLDEYLPITIDTLYQLTHFENAFEGGTFVEKWQLRNESSCTSSIDLWGYDIDIENIQCVAFQGSASKLFELAALRPTDKIIMFTNAEIALHDEYGTAEYWRARKSIQFNKDLIAEAEEFIKTDLGCKQKLCTNYISAHWRRRDFARSRGKAVPSIEGTAYQLNQIVKKTGINLAFIATDAISEEFIFLKRLLIKDGIDARFYVPSDEAEIKFESGGIAIIDQIICSRSAYFVGTHESTFTYRIQEEREIMGFDSDSTFNRFCPDEGECESPSRWTIVN